MKYLFYLMIVGVPLFGTGQTEFLQFTDSADFDYVNYELLKKHHLTVFKEYERIEDSLVLKRKTEYNFEDSTLKITDFKNKKWGKPRVYTGPMYDEVFEASADYEWDNGRVEIHDEFGRIVQSTWVLNPNQNKIETYFSYLDTTNYLGFKMEVHSNLNRYVTQTNITNYEYGVSSCSSATFCYGRWKYVSKRNKLENEGMKLVELTYINNYGLIMSRTVYDDSGEHSYLYKYE